jgi:hypothetical protein
VKDWVLEVVEEDMVRGGYVEVWAENLMRESDEISE